MARQQRDKAREQIAAGLDPAAEKQIETLARKVAADNTFKTIPEEWVAKNERPPGTTMSGIAWVGTCLNPKDGKSYIISYNDCCGKTMCKRCACDRASEDQESSHLVRPQTSGRYLWCGGSGESTVACTTANVVGVAMDSR